MEEKNVVCADDYDLTYKGLSKINQQSILRYCMQELPHQIVYLFIILRGRECVCVCVRVCTCVCVFAYAIESMSGQVNIRVGREKEEKE